MIRSPLTGTLVILALFAGGCSAPRPSSLPSARKLLAAGQHPKARDPIIPGSVFTREESPKPGDISVSIVGNVEHPCTHHLPAGSTLYQFLLRVGNFGGHGDMGGKPWKNVVITRKQPEVVRYTIELRGATKAALESFEMKDGDFVYMPEVIL